jgi:3-oxoacyl-[acyl-carrier protein] reductase
MLEGRTAYVTGSSRGIGAAIAETFARHGADVVVNGRSDAAALEALADRLRREHGVRTLAIAGDQSDPAAIKEAYRQIFRTFKRLDVLVNNAGILEEGLLGMITEESLTRTFSINALATARNMQAALSLMQRAGRGSIVNITSIMGRQGNPGLVAYAGSKAAVIGMTLSAAKELAPRNIRVNAIAPGFIDTDMVRSLTREMYDEKMRAIGMGRIGTPQDVANVALFLASDLAAYVTGQVIGVDGAMSV